MVSVQRGEGREGAGPLRLQRVQAKRGQRRISVTAEDGLERGPGIGSRWFGYHEPRKQVSFAMHGM